MKIFGGTASNELADAVCACLGIDRSKADVSKFSNDNVFVRVLESVREEEVYVIQTSCPPVADAFMELLIMVDALKRASVRRLTAVLPYYPYVRSDKKDQPRVPITARLVADLLITAGIDRAITVDLTADQIQGFFSVPVDHLTAQPVLARYFQSKQLTNAVVVAPDQGAVKRAQRFSQRLNLPVAFVDKRRSSDGADVTASAVVGDVTGRDVIIFDEEIDRASSVCEVTSLLRRHDVGRIYVACTHAVFSGPAVQRLQDLAVQEVVVTDTVPVPPAKRWDGLVVLPIAPLIAEAIRRTHSGESVSALFV